MSLEKTNAIYMVLHKAMKDYLEEGKKADDLINDEMYRGMSVNYYSGKYTNISNEAINNFIDRLEELHDSDAYKELVMKYKQKGKTLHQMEPNTITEKEYVTEG